MKKAETFINKCLNKYGNKFDYSNVEYVKSSIKINIRCKAHGIFSMTPNNHLRGQECPICWKESKKMTHEQFLKLSTKTNKDIIIKSIYTNNETKMNFECVKCQYKFTIYPWSFLSSTNCKNCYLKKLSNIAIARGHSRLMNSNDFLKKAKNVHGCDKYDYSLTRYKSSMDDVIIICKKHGEFNQRPNMHIIGQGCPHCNESKGEKQIVDILENNKIKFIRQYKFDDCKHKYKLRFDFYLPELNICIEYDGEQHFKPVKYFGGSKAFLALKLRDDIKNDFCKDNGIKLLRIPFFEKELKNYLKINLTQLDN